jgi:flagellar basal-body rod modification protein FlgD
MATEGIGSNNALSQLDPSLTAAAEKAKAKKQGEVGKDEFLQLLVTQLKNQDPLDPMKNEDFAVNLAQFSQLEQLISINDKINPEGGGSDIGGLASYLGHQVVLNSSDVTVTGGTAGQATFKLDSAATNVKLDLTDSEGNVKESFDLGPLDAGEQIVDLKGLTVPNGTYTVQVTALSAFGTTMTPKAFGTGIVSGFIPGAEPKLLVNGNEIDPTDVREVRAGQ